MPIEPPPRIIEKFNRIWRDWLFYFWDNIQSHSGGSVPTPPTTGANWNAHGNDGVGGGVFSTDNYLTIPPAFAYQIDGLDAVAIPSPVEITIGNSNTNTPGQDTGFPSATRGANIQLGRNLLSVAGARGSLNVGENNLVGWVGDIGLGRNITTGEVVGGINVAVGHDIECDEGGVGFGKQIAAILGVAFGDNCSTDATNSFVAGVGSSVSNAPSGSSVAIGINCVITNDLCGALGMNISNDQTSTFKIGFNNATAIVIAGNGLGVALGIGNVPLARLHLGAPSALAPSIILEPATFGTVNTPIAGAIEYAEQTTFIDIASYAVSDPAEFTTVSPHGVSVGGTLIFSGLTGGNFIPTLPNGVEREFVSTGASTFTVDSLECVTAASGDGSMEYTNGDHYLFFTHSSGTRSTILTTQHTVLDAMAASNSIDVTPLDSVIYSYTGTGFTGSVNLPVADSANNVVFNIKHMLASLGTTTIAPFGTDLVDRKTSISLSPNDSAQCMGKNHPNLSESQTDISFTSPNTIASAALADFSSLSPGDVISVSADGGGHAANNSSPTGTTQDGWTVVSATTLTIVILEGGITNESAATAGTVTILSLGFWELI